MNITDFVKNFALQFDDTDPELIESNTNFKDIEEWSSLTALSVIAMVDEEYSVKLSGSDIKGANTVADLYEIVNGRI